MSAFGTRGMESLQVLDGQVATLASPYRAEDENAFHPVEAWCSDW
jgi:hypothetical protein